MLKKAAAVGTLAALVYLMPAPPGKIEGVIVQVSSEGRHLTVQAGDGTRTKVSVGEKTKIHLVASPKTTITLEEIGRLREHDIDLRAVAEYDKDTATATEIEIGEDPGLRGRLYSVDVNGKQVLLLQPTDHDTLITWDIHVTPRTRLTLRRGGKDEETDLNTLLGLTRDRARILMRVRTEKPVEEGDDSATARSILFVVTTEEEGK